MEQNSNSLDFFFRRFATDGRISCTHIGIYAALLNYRAINNFVNPIQVHSHEIMEIAKISDRKTYCNSLHRLSEVGAIRYEPSCKRYQKSKIYFSQ